MEAARLVHHPQGIVLPQMEPKMKSGLVLKITLRILLGPSVWIVGAELLRAAALGASE